MKKMLFIYNPHAGKGRIHSALAEVIDRFAAEDYLVTVYPTRGRADATDAAARLGGDYDRVVCCGGDGTLSEVVAGMLQLKRPPVLGYIPAGTTNDFSHNLHLPRGMAAAASCAAAGVPRPCDMGRFNGRSFLYVAAFGAFTDVAYDTPQQLKNMFGHMAYVLGGAAKLPNLQTYSLRVEYDGGVLEGDYLFGMVSNTISVGGFRGIRADQVSLDDGQFEVFLVKMPHTPADYQSLIQSMVQQKPHGCVTGFSTSRVRFTAPTPLSWTLDGEFGGAHTQAEVEVLPQALTLVYGK